VAGYLEELARQMRTAQYAGHAAEHVPLPEQFVLGIREDVVNRVEIAMGKLLREKGETPCSTS
jgi:hypothetical protein